MCLLALCESRHFTKEEFEASWKKNSDGFGYGWIEDNKIKFKKGFMELENAYEEYLSFCKKEIFPYVVHFRLGSPTCPELTHPFIISEESPLLLENNDISESVLFHNGIITSWENKLFSLFLYLKKVPKGEWSDTRMLASSIAISGVEMIGQVNGKYIYIDKNTNEITYYGDFTDAEGIQMSNDSYKVYKYNYQHVNYTPFKAKKNYLSLEIEF